MIINYSHGCASLQVTFDLIGELCVVTVQFLVELTIAIVDWSDVLAVVIHSLPRELITLLNHLLHFFGHHIDPIRGWGVLEKFWDLVNSFLICPVDWILVEYVPAERLFSWLVPHTIFQRTDCRLSQVLFTFNHTFLLLVREVRSCLSSLVVWVIQA